MKILSRDTERILSAGIGDDRRQRCRVGMRFAQIYEKIIKNVRFKFFSYISYSNRCGTPRAAIMYCHL